MPDYRTILHQVTLDAVRREATALVRGGLDPETIDLDSLLVACSRVAYYRTDEDPGVEGHIVRALLALAARALLWSQSADDLAAILDSMPAEGDDQIEALLALMDEQHSTRPALGEGS
jgi:hypothetical protein